MSAPGRVPLPDLPDATSQRAGEFAKSGRTRRRILDAAIGVLAREGYARLAISGVAAAAGLSRAAMIYHFPTRRALVEALVAHVTRERVAIYEAGVAALRDRPDFGARAVDLAWEQAASPVFAAFAELAQAARTDPELAGIFRPALAAFDMARRAAANRIFPDGLRAITGFDLGRDVVRFLIEGVTQQDAVVHDRDARLAALAAFTRLVVNSPEGQALLARAIAEAGADGGVGKDGR